MRNPCWVKRSFTRRKEDVELRRWVYRLSLLLIDWRIRVSQTQLKERIDMLQAVLRLSISGVYYLHSRFKLSRHSITGILQSAAIRIQLEKLVYKSHDDHQPENKWRK